MSDEDATFKELLQHPLTQAIVDEALQSGDIDGTARKYGYEPDDFRKAGIAWHEKMLETLDRR